MLKIKTAFLCLLIPCFLWGQWSGQDARGNLYHEEDIQEHPFDEDRWEEIVEGLDYTEQIREVKKRETVNAQQGQEGRDYEESARPPFSLNQGSGIMKILIILLAIVVLVFLLRGLMGSDLKVKNKKIKKKGEAIDIQRIEEDIENADLQHFIDQALKNEQYALAIRLYYLSALKELTLKKTIKWKKDKTNLDYLSEMRSSEHFHSFRSITQIFERVWYGEHPLDREGFLKLEPEFKQFINHLNEVELVQ